MKRIDMSSFGPVYRSPEGKEEIQRKYDEILKQCPVAYEELHVNTSYGNTYVIRSGDHSLPALLLLHGTSSNSAFMLGEIIEYSKHYCVYAIDIPGEPGKSEERQYSLVHTVYYSWLKELIDQLSLTNVSILGLSLGGWLITGFASRYPNYVEKLVLLCPSGIGKQRVSFIFKAVFYMLQGDRGRDKLAKLVNGNQPIPNEVKEYTSLIASQFHLRKEQVPIYPDEELKQLQMPLLLIVGEKDVLLDSNDTARRIQRLLPHARVMLLPDHGHVLIGLQADILRFLSERSPDY